MQAILVHGSGNIQAATSITLRARSMMMNIVAHSWNVIDKAQFRADRCQAQEHLQH